MKGPASPAAQQRSEASSPETRLYAKREEATKDGIKPARVAHDNQLSKPLHQEPAGECLVCFDTLEKRNYAEYALQVSSCSPRPPDDSSDTTHDESPASNVKHAEAVESSASENQHTTSRGKGEATGFLSTATSGTGASELVWYPAKFCKDCIEELQAVQFQRYCDSVANTNCAREQRALLKRGPPINLRDRMAFPESNDQEIHALWYAADDKVRPAKLKGSLEGEKRQALWNWLEQFIIEDEHVAEDMNGKRTESS